MQKFFNLYKNKRKETSYVLFFYFLHPDSDKDYKDLKYMNSVKDLGEEKFMSLIGDKEAQIKLCEKEVRRVQSWDHHRSEEYIQMQVDSIEKLSLESIKTFELIDDPSGHKKSISVYYLPDRNEISIHVEPSYIDQPEIEAMVEEIENIDARTVYDYVKSL